MQVQLPEYEKWPFEWIISSLSFFRILLIALAYCYLHISPIGQKLSKGIQKYGASAWSITWAPMGLDHAGAFSSYISDLFCQG